MTKKKLSTPLRSFFKILTVIWIVAVIDEILFSNNLLKDVEVVHFTDNKYLYEHEYHAELKQRRDHDKIAEAENEPVDASKAEIDSSIALLPKFFRNHDTSTEIDNDISKSHILSELDELSRGYEASDLDCPFPLTSFHNRIKESNLTFESFIPKILHVSFQSRCVGRDHAYFLSRWSDALEDYSIFYYDDESVEKLINEEWPEFPGLHDAMKCVLYKGAMTVDVWRILVLYKYGGIYTDIDNTPTELFDQNVIPTNVSGFFFSDHWNRPSQWFMAVEPKHPIMFLSMSYIIDNLLSLESIVGPQTVFVTGPGAVLKAYETFLHRESLKDLGSAVHVTGLFGKKVKKVLKDETHKFIIPQNTDEIVTFNATLNMTRGERISRDTGILHWTKVKYKAWKNRVIPDMSCREFLEVRSRKDDQDFD